MTIPLTKICKRSWLAPLLAASLLLGGCGASTGASTGAQTGAVNSSNPPTATAPAGAEEGGTGAGGAASPSGSSSGSEVTPDATKLKLTSMYFLNERQGWTVADTAAGSELWFTADAGGSWSKAALAGSKVSAIGFTDAKQGWAVSRSDCVPPENGTPTCKTLAMLHTDDGGSTWSPQWKSSGSFPITGEDRVFPADNAHIFAIAAQQLIRTADGGGTWSPVTFHIGPFIPEKASFAADGKHGWVLGRAGKGCKADQNEAREQCAITVVTTTDGGETWDLQWSPDDSTSMRNVGISFIDPQQGWMMVLHMESMQSYLYRTTDGGAHWAKISEMRGARPYTAGLQFVSPQTGFIPLSVGAGPVAGGLAVATDGGRTLERRVQPEKEWSFESLQFFNDRSGWVRVFDPSEGDYLVYTSDGGTSWTTVRPRVTSNK